METWFQKHTALILGLALLGVALWLGNKSINANAAKADTLQTVAQQQLADQTKNNNDLAEKVANNEANYQQLLATVSAQTEALAKAISNRNQAAATQQKNDATIPLLNLGYRWEAILGLQLADIKSTGDSLVVSDQASRTTVENLELIQPLQENTRDQQAIIASRDQQITNLDGIVGGLQGQVSGLNTQVTDTGKLCQLQIADLKAQQKKKSRNWFLRGLAVGGAIAGYLLR